MTARRPTLTATLKPTADGSNDRCLAVAHLDCEPCLQLGCRGLKIDESGIRSFAVPPMLSTKPLGTARVLGDQLGGLT
jgi:hypothetical protein